MEFTDTISNIGMLKSNPIKKDNDGKTALMLAVQNNHDDVVRVLKEAGETE